MCFKDSGPSVEIMWLNKTKKNPLSWWKTHFAQKMPWKWENVECNTCMSSR